MSPGLGERNVACPLFRNEIKIQYPFSYYVFFFSFPKEERLGVNASQSPHCLEAET